MQRRDFLKMASLCAASTAGLRCLNTIAATTSPSERRPPNVVFILADDLGYADLGCYGQKRIRTPNIDRIAAGGVRFSQFYSGNPVCAPSRCTLMTGYHTGHAQVRDNMQVGGEEGWKLGSTIGGQWPLAEGTFTVAHLFKKAGYVTGAFGKWGLGRVGTTGDPQKQGFDHFFGYICQRQAHTYYPNHLWRDGEIFWIEENKDAERVYSIDLIAAEALKFVRANKDKPFFLYVPFTIPHVALQVPEDSLAEYEDVWPDPPYDGKKGYVAHPHPRACYAAMVTRMDKYVGQITALLQELGLEENTLVIFSSDNGPTSVGGSDAGFFKSAGPLHGLKGSVWDGGIRVPFIARWPGRIKPGSESDQVAAFWDFLPTCAELLDVQPPEGIDGMSILPMLLGRRDQQKKHEYLYWELSGQQAVRLGDWKAVRLKPDEAIQVFNLAKDIGERIDVAGQNPDVVARVEAIFARGRTESDVFPLRKPQPAKKK
jgi:arylsulfatase